MIFLLLLKSDGEKNFNIVKIILLKSDNCTLAL